MGDYAAGYYEFWADMLGMPVEAVMHADGTGYRGMGSGYHWSDQMHLSMGNYDVLYQRMSTDDFLRYTGVVDHYGNMDGARRDQVARSVGTTYTSEGDGFSNYEVEYILHKHFPKDFAMTTGRKFLLPPSRIDGRRQGATAIRGGNTKWEGPLATWDPVTNDRLAGLQVTVRETAVMFINQVESELGIQLRVTDGYRTAEEQNALYAIGRSPKTISLLGGLMNLTIPDTRKKVTNAKAWQSYHNYGLAFDVVEILNGQANYDTDWFGISRIGKSLGLEWGGDWRFEDKPHFQQTFGRSIKWLYKHYRN